LANVLEPGWLVVLVPDYTKLAVSILSRIYRKTRVSEFKSLLRDLAVLIGMDTATLLERETLAEEIAYQLKLQE
jgi:energy-coupling factor transporter transmembrane protein EcfT